MCQFRKWSFFLTFDIWRRTFAEATLDPKCELIISSLLTLPDLLDHLICIVSLLQIMEGWDRLGVVDLYYDVGGSTGGGYHLIVFTFVLCFSILLSRAPCLFIQVARAWWLLLCFFLANFVSGLFFQGISNA